MALNADEQRVIQKLQSQPGLILQHGVGTGKALLHSTKLATAGGWKLLSEIRVGDQITGDDGKPTTVVGVYPQGIKPLWKVEFDDLTSAVCCDEHLWKCVDRVREFKEIRENYKQREFRIPLNSLIPDFPTLDRTTLLRSLGFKVVDGSLFPETWKQVTNVTYWGEDEAICIEVDNESRCFLIDDFTVTHNTKKSIEAYKALGMPTSVVVPAALKDNYRKELNKWMGNVPEDVHILSQQALARKGYGDPTGLLVVDEGHKARNTGSKLIHALRQTPAQKTLLLSATPTWNAPHEVAPLVNLVAGKKVLPESEAGFKEKFVEQTTEDPGILARVLGAKPVKSQRLKNKDELSKVLNQYIDYKPGQVEGFPEVREEIVKVPMAPEQVDLYRAVMEDAPLWLKWKIRSGLPADKSDLTKFRPFLTGARQISNSTYEYTKDKSRAVHPKIDRAVNFLKEQIAQNPDYKGVVYSNYIDSGLTPYAQRLDEAGIPYGVFSGDIEPEVRDQMVRDYNIGKLKALLISSAGAEGLDLKGTRVLQMLEPHYNEEKEKQIAGRAARYLSHAALPKEHQNVVVQRYMTAQEPNLLDKILGNKERRGVDEYIRDLAVRKAKLNNQLQSLLVPH